MTDEAKADIEPLFQFFRGFRRRRMQLFFERFNVRPETRVLDIGGREFNWTLAPLVPRVTILNVEVQGSQSGQFEWVMGDARELPFSDQSFEIVYSNSVIEHLGAGEDQRRFADEVRRVGYSYLCKRRIAISFSNRTWLRHSFTGCRKNGRPVCSATLLFGAGLHGPMQRRRPVISIRRGC